MANLTLDETRTTIQEFLCTPGHTGIHSEMLIIIEALNVLLAITAFLGNILIIVALQKPSTLYPPSKFLLGSLASTDLCVGLITPPLFVSFLLSPKHSRLCNLLSTILYTLGGTFCGVSFLILTAISADRYLALMLGLRYRQRVTLNRVRVAVAIFWIISGATVMTLLYDFHITIGITCVLLVSCATGSTYCYTKIFLTFRHHQVAVQEHFHQGENGGPNEGGTSMNIARYRKTVAAVLWVQIALLASNLPYGIVTVVLAITGFRTTSLYLAWVVTVSFLLFNSSLNPFLYRWKIKDVRQAVRDAIGHFMCF